MLVLLFLLNFAFQQLLPLLWKSKWEDFLAVSELQVNICKDRLVSKPLQDGVDKTVCFLIHILPCVVHPLELAFRSVVCMCLGLCS